jgi:hypothetical protein
MIHQTMGTTVISHQKNGKNSVMNGVVKLRVQNMVIVLNVRIQRKDGTKNDLPLHAATDNLRHRCGHREVINKDMTDREAICQIGRVMQDVLIVCGKPVKNTRKKDCYKALEAIQDILLVDYRFNAYENAKQMLFNRFASDEIQHVSYDDAQLGREK